MRRTHLLPLMLVTLLLAAVTPLLAAPGVPTIVPLGPSQSGLRPAYGAVFSHISAGGRAHWAQQAFTYAGTTYDPGTVVAPKGIAATGFASTVVTSTLAVAPALALNAEGTRIAIFRSTVSDPSYGTAAWEVADVRETLDTYLGGALRYDILDETTLATADLTQYALLILPSLRLGNEAQVITKLGATNLARIDAFVRQGGTLYTQSNGATIAEAAGVVAPGTVDLTTPLQLTSWALPNIGDLGLLDAASPLAFNWLTPTLYLLNDPTLAATTGLTAVAELTNLDSAWQPAILSGEVGLGRVILVAGHPTAATHREQVPLFLNALLWALGQPAELFGDAVQTYNPAMDPHLLPAYEPGTPVSVTLTFNNLWNTPMTGVVISETVAAGFDVLTNTITPLGSATVLSPTGETVVTWNLGDVPTGEVALSFQATTGSATLARGKVTFATGQASFTHAGLTRTVGHQPFTLTSRMAARLVADRDIEADRQYVIPAEGLFLDATVPIENKEDTLASNVVVTDVVLLIAPVVGMDNQQRVLADGNGDTVWVRNEPFFYNETGGGFQPPISYTVGQTVTLSDWTGEYAIFDQINGTAVNSITIPLTYTNIITYTSDGRLMLPVKTLTWNLNAWPGYYYEEPAVRYGIHSSELMTRTVTFLGDTTAITGTDVIVQDTSGSVYTHVGSTPVHPRDYLSSGTLVTVTTAVSPTIAYADIWARTHELPLRAAFYDIFGWTGCATCGTFGANDGHSALNVTFGMRADLDGDGVREADVLVYPSRLGSADLDIVIKDRSAVGSVASNEMLVDLGMFQGLGISITPRSGAWGTSWSSSDTGATLAQVQSQGGYDRLLFHHTVPAAGATTITLQARVSSDSSDLTEGMLKLHDGARYTYRQPAAGPSRYEIADTRVQGVLGAGPQVTVRGQGAPVQINTYGDTVYLIYTLDDPDDPRTLVRNGPGDPFLQSYGFTDYAATTYVGGREGNQILHSLVKPGERTQIRVEVDNNSAVPLTNVVVTPQPPAGLTVTQAYTSVVPLPIYPDLPFLYAGTIPEAGRGVYIFDVAVDANYSGPLGQIIEMPITFSATGVPTTTNFQIPPAQIGIEDANGEVALVYGPAQTLVLSDTLPTYVEPGAAAVVTQAELTALTGATDDAGRAAAFASFSEPISFTLDVTNTVQYSLPTDAPQRLYDHTRDHRIMVVAQGTIQPPTAGPTLASGGAVVDYTDQVGLNWRATSTPVLVEANGAAVQVRYACEQAWMEGAALRANQTKPLSTPTCELIPGASNVVAIKATIMNVGDYPALGVTSTLMLPTGATLLGTDPTPESSSDQEVTWSVGDLAPGAARDVQILVVLPVPETVLTAGTLAPAAIAPIAIVTQSNGGFTDALSNQRIYAQLAGAFTLPVRASQLAGAYTVYLPYVNLPLFQFTTPPTSTTTQP